MINNGDLLQSELQIDPIGTAHLREAVKWARFIAIIGFVGSGFMLLIAVFGVSMMDKVNSSSTLQPNAFMSGAMVGIFYFIAAVIFFFLCLYLFRFASKMHLALNTTDQDSLNDSFKNLKLLYRMTGIITIINLALFVLAIIVSIGAVALQR